MNPDVAAFPKVILAGREAEIVLTPLHGSTVFAPSCLYQARFFSKVNRSEDWPLKVSTDRRGVIRHKLRFATPGEYILDITTKNDKGEEKLLASEAFFAVKPELAGLRPYKGDVHMHTRGSDGRHAPLTMALRARELGLDFVAVTDHDNQPPSVEAAKLAARSGLNLLVIPGEEVTIRESQGHILALNASECVGKLRHKPAAEAEYARIAREELAGRALIPPLTPETYARAVWTIRTIRELGGCALIAHPFWNSPGRRYYPPCAVTEQLLRDGLCDGLELWGGSSSIEGNCLAVARHCDEAARGRRLPVVGGSDAHADSDLGLYWTIVFTRELSVKGVLDAILNLRSVACGPRLGAEVAMFGTFELTEYAYFMQREFFPLHDALCRVEAGLCAAGLGPRSARGQRIAAELRALHRRFWRD